MADTFFDLVRVFAPDKEFSKLEEIKVSDKDKEYISSLFAKNNIAEDCPVIGIHPGTGKRAKMRQWPPDKFARLADKLAAEFNAGIIFTGFGADTVLVENIAGKMKSASFNFCGATSLKELAALIQRLDLFISNDTGPMHLGPAMGTLTVGLFGPNTPARYGPFGKEHLALYAAPSCSPCINIHLGKVKNCARPVCMEKLEVGAVFAQIAARLERLKHK
jgi:heptosyltransferase-2